MNCIIISLLILAVIGISMREVDWSEESRRQAKQGEERER